MQAAGQTDPQYEQHKRDCDEMNTPPHFCRVTTNVWPIVSSTKSKAGVPIGLVFQPLGLPPKGVPDVNVVNFGASGTVVRRSATE